MNTISKILWAILAGIVMLWVGGGTPAEATRAEVCYEDVVKDVIEKETRTITKVKDGVITWTDWADWPGVGPVTDDGRARGPLPHNNEQPGTKGYREYRYVVVGSTTVKVEVKCPPEETTTTSSTTSTSVPEQSTTTTVQDTTTTLNETTTTVQQPTTIPPITGPATVPSTTPIPDECWIDDNPLTAIPAGSFTFYGPESERAIGTHSISGQPCGPTGVGCYLVRPCVPDIVYTTPPPTPTGTLPETGTSSWTLVALATAMLGAGAFAMKVARR